MMTNAIIAGSDLLPCANCGEKLVREGAGLYRHPRNECFLWNYQLQGPDFSAWNRRAAPTAQPTPQIIGCVAREAPSPYVALDTAQPTLPDDERAAFEKWWEARIGAEFFNYGDKMLAEAAWQARAALRQPGALPDEAEDAARYKQQRDNLLSFIQNADVSSGICCCGDDMKRHGNPMDCGHNPVDMWDHSVMCFAEEIEKSDAARALAAKQAGKEA